MEKSNSLTKAEIVYKSIRTDIINCNYKLGEIINEKVIAEKYNVSKTPIREALSILVKEGYLIKYPRLGYFVKELNLEEFYQIVQLRFILESGIIRYIISSVSDEEIDTLNDYITEKYVKIEDYYETNMNFHMAMAKLLKNKHIYDSLKHVLELNTRQVSVEFYNKVSGDIHCNHRELIKFLKNRDLDASIDMIRNELTRTDDNVSWF